MFIKNNLRYFLGKVILKLKITERLKSTYLYYVASIIKTFPKDAILTVWVRRSFLTKDFTPIWSDIDLTVLISKEKLHELIINPPRAHYPLIDIQYVHESFFRDWKDAGGIRNRLFSSWQNIHGQTHELVQTDVSNSEFIALEVSYEVYLLYQQLEALLFKNDLFSERAKKKLIIDLYKLKFFWTTKDISWLSKNRADISVSQDTLEFLDEYNIFLREIFQNLPIEFQSYSIDSLEKEVNSLGKSLYLEINQKQVFVVNSFKDIEKTHKEKMFLSSEIFMKLIKAVGIQDQEILNRYTHEKNELIFRQFCIQRLANDLIGAVLTTKRSQASIYYTLKNVHEFSFVTRGEAAPYWQMISKRWDNQEPVVLSSYELAKIAQAQLDLLLSMR